MDIYIYAKSGHKLGLERVRRCSALYKQTTNDKGDIFLATSDFRAATFAKQNLGATKSVGVDIIQNLPNIMQRGDVLIYDSDEVSPALKESMKEFCSEVYEIGADIDDLIVDDIYKSNNFKTQREFGFFYGDDDYDESIFSLLKDDFYDIELLWGHYFFVNNEDRLKPYFKNIIQEDEYFDFITTTKYLITASPQTALESYFANNTPIFFQRQDKQYDLSNLKKLGIKIINDFDLSKVGDYANS